MSSALGNDSELLDWIQRYSLSIRLPKAQDKTMLTRYCRSAKTAQMNFLFSPYRTILTRVANEYAACLQPCEQSPEKISTEKGQMVAKHVCRDTSTTDHSRPLL